MLTALPVPAVRVPRVIGIDDFALKRRHRYATVVIDAETVKRNDVLPDRTLETVAALRKHPGAEYVCRDGSGSYGEAIRQALPEAVRVSDRWHLWKHLCEKAHAEVRSHAACWSAAVNPALPGGVREQTDPACRRPGRPGPAALPRDPGAGLHRQPQPPLQVRHPGPHRGRTAGHHPAAVLPVLLSRPENLRDQGTTFLRELISSCPELGELTKHVGEFARLLTPAEGNDTKLTEWIAQVRAADLPYLHSFANGLELDRAAVVAGLSLPYHNGRTEGVNTRTKKIMRQMHGRVGLPLLRILLQ